MSKGTCVSTTLSDRQPTNSSVLLDILYISIIPFVKIHIPQTYSKI